MLRALSFLLLATIAAAPARASIGCVVRPAAGETTTLRAAPFARAPGLEELARGRVVRLGEVDARGWRLVEVWPQGEVCCADAAKARPGWVRAGDLDDCG